MKKKKNKTNKTNPYGKSPMSKILKYIYAKEAIKDFMWNRKRKDENNA